VIFYYKQDRGGGAVGGAYASHEVKMRATALSVTSVCMN